VHRLLKNTAANELGLRGYALCSDACIDALGIDAASLGLSPHSETYADVGDVAAWVIDLEKRWQTESERQRVFVAEADEGFSVGVDLHVPVAIAWEYLTSPEKRLLWQVDNIDQADEGGRRSTGTSSVCIDGRTKIYEEILDWRPFDYFTERVSLGGRTSALLTTELREHGDETQVVTRVRPEGGRVRRLTAGPRLGDAFSPAMTDSRR
jgi:hypothetical protein